jgi:hypothetical protein
MRIADPSLARRPIIDTMKEREPGTPSRCRHPHQLSRGLRCRPMVGLAVWDIRPFGSALATMPRNLPRTVGADAPRPSALIGCAVALQSRSRLLDAPGLDWSSIQVLNGH